MEKQNSLVKKFYDYILNYNLFTSNEELLVAVSGGVDSVVLFYLLKKLKFTFFVAHCNFHLRNSDSDEDEHFVKELCDENNIPLFIQHFDTKDYALKKKISIELAARELRYQWFNEICLQKNIKKLIVAHHANDNLETSLYHMIKGTGISGLRGMNNISSWGERYIIRPLLFATKEELVHYAKENNLQWREDYTNNDNTYARNLIRNEIIPKLKIINPNIEKNFYNTAERIYQTELFLQEQLEKIKEQYIRENKDFVKINVADLKKNKWFHTVIWELLKNYDFSYKQLTTLLTNSLTPRMISNKKYEIYDLNDKWIISPKKNYTITLQIFEKENTIIFDDVTIKKEEFNNINYKITKANNVAAIDADKLVFPLILRYWQEGDIFYPIGKKKFRKNVSDFLNDLKIILPMKKKVLVLENNGDIVWVVGLRLDDRYKITEKTEKIIEYKIF